MRNPICCLTAIVFGFGCGTANDDATDYEKLNAPRQTWNMEDGIAQGFTFNRNWEMSVEIGAGLIDLHTDSSGTTYAISDYGILLSRKVNEDWKREMIDAGYSRFNAICGYGNDVYVVGSKSAIFHKKGNSDWKREPVASANSFFDQAYAFGNELWVSEGRKGIIWHRNNAGAWKKETALEGNIIHRLYGYGEEVWALGNKVVYRKKPGKEWRIVHATPEKVDFTTMYKNEHLVWIMGTHGAIWFNTGDDKWIKETPEGIDDDITCSYGKNNDVYAAGKNGLILHRMPGGKWEKEENVYSDFFAVTMHGLGNDWWIAGNDGFIIHKKGTAPWEKEAGPTRGVWMRKLGSANGSVFAAGGYATIMTRGTDSNWQKAHSLMPDTPMTGLFRYEDHILVTGNNGTVSHRLPNSFWKSEHIDAADDSYLDMYEGKEKIYLCGSQGTVASRKKTDSVWLAEKLADGRLTKIYGYENKIWVFGHHSMVLFKKEEDTTWTEYNIGVSEVDFMDVYGWKGQLWVLGVKEGLGIIFHKDEKDVWSMEEIPRSTDHYHALYGRSDTIWAVGASGDWGLKYKSSANYAGTIICKEGNNPWKKQIDYLPGAHFDAIGGTGIDVYAIGKAGVVYHKHGGSDWKKIETFHEEDEFTKIIFYKGIILLSENGFLYKQDNQRNFISINRTDRLLDMVPLGDDLICLGKTAVFKINPAEEKYPVVDQVSYTLRPFINPGAIDLNVLVKRPPNLTANDNYGLYFYARPYSEDFKDHKWIYINGGKVQYEADKGNAFGIGQRIEVAKSLRVIPGLENANKICIRVDISTEDGRARESFLLNDANGNNYFRLSNNFWLKYKTWIIAAAILFTYYTFWVFLWGFYPLTFLRVYNSEKLQQLLLLKPPFHMLIGVVNVLLPLKKLADTAHAQKAWIKNFSPIAISKFEKSEIVDLHKEYVSLPARTDHPVTGNLIEKPDAALLQKLFQKDRTIIQVIGPGGAGKTTLAIAMGKWIFQASKNKQPARIPILLETDNTDLLKSITAMVRAWQNDYAIREDFVKMLLKNQRLVVIADSLSEKNVSIQEYFKTIHGEIPLNALIITARQPVDLQVKEGSFLYPAALASNNLLYFIITYLNVNPDHPLQDSREQLVFAEKVVSIIEGNNNKAPITPILVKLIIEIAFKTEGETKKDFQTILDEMPDSIPDVYYKYLALVNPSNPSTENYLPRQSMLKIAELLGQLSLQENYIPQEFPEEAARKAIAQEFDHLPGDPIQRLIDNGIITRKESLARSYLRFNIDPLAEYLAASRLYDLHSKNPQDLIAFTSFVDSRGEEAREFKMAFSQVCEYKAKRG